MRLITATAFVALTSAAALPNDTAIGLAPLEKLGLPTTYEYGGLGNGVYHHFMDSAGKVYYAFQSISDPPRAVNGSDTTTGKDLTSRLSKRENVASNPVKTYPWVPQPSDPIAWESWAKGCKGYSSNPIPQRPGGDPFGPWCDKPNDPRYLRLGSDPQPWKCNVNGRSFDSVKYVSSRNGMQQYLLRFPTTKGHAITVSSPTTRGDQPSGTANISSKYAWNDVAAYVCFFDKKRLSYNGDQFDFMAGQMLDRCGGSEDDAEVQQMYYDGSYYSVGFTLTGDVNGDQDQCAERSWKPWR